MVLAAWKAMEACLEWTEKTEFVIAPRGVSMSRGWKTKASSGNYKSIYNYRVFFFKEIVILTQRHLIRQWFLRK